MRQQKIAQDQQGMTLVEVMLGFAIFAVVLTLSLSIMMFGSKILSLDSEQDRLKMLGDEMYTLLSQKLAFATHIEILPEGTPPDDASYENIILIQDGELLFGTKNGTFASPYENDIDQNTTLTFTTTVESASVLSLDLTFDRMEDGTSETLYTTASSLRLINLAAGADPVEIEGSGTTVNPVISYDTEPYSIEEGYTAVSDTPYTVACYVENQTPVPLVNGTMYEPGTIIVNDNGDYWQAVQWVTYYSHSPTTVPGHPHSYLWKSLEEEWKNESYKSVYEYHDVISYKGKYYMSTIKWYLNTWNPLVYGWIQVFWIPEYNTSENRMLGWSLNPSSQPYRSIYTRYP